MYTSVNQHEALQQSNKYNATHHPNAYMAESGSYNGTNNNSPIKVSSPTNRSNLQTLRKFSNLQSLQSLNLNNMVTDSPRASYSSTSSSTTSSSSSNLIIPEIFKQDPPVLPQSSYPPPVQHLPPKPRNTQSPPQLNHTQLPNSNYLHHPQPLPPQTPLPPHSKYQQPYYPVSQNNPKIDAAPRLLTNDQQNSVIPINGLNGSLCPSSFQKYPANYGYSPSSSNAHPATFVLHQQQQCSGGFTSYPNSSSFTSYTSTNSHYTSSTNSPSYLPSPLAGPPNHLLPPRSPPHTSGAGTSQIFSGLGPQTNQPDVRRLSDPNNRRSGVDIQPVQMTHNEYPPHSLPSKINAER